MRRVAPFALVLFLPALAVAGPEASAVQIARLVGFGDDERGVMSPRCAYGSGTVVHSKDGQSFVLTNKHVCPDGNALQWVRSGDTLYRAEFVAAAADADLALLRINKELPAVGVAAAEPVAGTELRQWGHPRAGRAKARAGPSIGMEDGFRDEEGRAVFLAGYPCEVGDSGAGAFDPAGRLVGVCCVQFKLFPDRAGLVPLADVRKFLAAHLKGK